MNGVMKSYIFIVGIAAITYTEESEALQHGDNILHNQDLRNKKELIQIIEKLHKEHERKKDPENDLEDVLVRNNGESRGNPEDYHDGKEPRVLYIANPAVLEDFMKRLNNKSDYLDLSHERKIQKYISRRNARFRLVDRPNEEKNVLYLENNGVNDNQFTGVMTPSLQDQVSSFKHYNDDEEKERNHKSEEYNIKLKERYQNNPKPTRNGISIIEHSKNPGNDWDNTFNKNKNGRDKKNTDWNSNDKKKDWNDPNKNVKWENQNKNDDWGITDKTSWDHPEYKKKDGGNNYDWTENVTTKKEYWNNNAKSLSLEKNTKNRMNYPEVTHKKINDENNYNKKNNGFNIDWTKKYANKNAWDAVGVDYNNPTTKNKERFRNNYDTVDLDKKLKLSKKPAWKDDIVNNLKKMEKENNDWSKITNSWNQNNVWDIVTNNWNENKKINSDTKKNTWKKNKDRKIIPTTRDDFLYTIKTTRGVKKSKLKNIGNWDQPLPNFENRYKHKIADFYRPNRDKEYRNIDSQSLGRTPIPFIGKKDIYADK